MSDNQERKGSFPPSAEAQDEAYSVGYKNPPKEFRFKKGNSGNPSGKRRPKPSVKSMFEEEFLRKITAREGDRVITLTKAGGMIKRLLADGLKGDKAAIRLAFNIADKFGVGEVTQVVEEAFSEGDEVILDAYLKKRSQEEK
jgi:hypothetical protein